MVLKSIYDVPFIPLSPLYPLRINSGGEEKAARAGSAEVVRRIVALAPERSRRIGEEVA